MGPGDRKVEGLVANPHRSCVVEAAAKPSVGQAAPQMSWAARATGGANGSSRNIQPRTSNSGAAPLVGPSQNLLESESVVPVREEEAIISATTGKLLDIDAFKDYGQVRVQIRSTFCADWPHTPKLSLFLALADR
jgi:hypothetical protein